MKHHWLLTAGHLTLATAVNATEPTRLDQINVTANRTARTVDQTLAPVEVITRAMIERSQATDLPQLIAGLAGIDMTRQGGYGQVSSLFLRGASSYQTQVLIDGIRVGSASLGTVSLQTISVKQIERIEIVRGPRSSLYGADAIGGVIHIFTRQGKSGLHPSVNASYGNHNTKDLSVNLGVGGDATRFNLNLAYFDTDGINALKDNNPDKDGYTNNSLSASVKHNLGQDNELSLQILRNQGNTQYDSPYDPAGEYDEDFLQQTINAKLTLSPMQHWGTSLSLGMHRDESTQYSNDQESSDFNTRRIAALWQNDIALNTDQLLTAGLELVREYVDVSTEYTEDSRNNKALFLQYLADLDAVGLSLGLRRDENQSYGEHNTGNLSLGHDLTPALRLVASYATSFRAPTFNDLYYQDPWGSRGNPDLDPEKSRNKELGLVGRQVWGNWELRLFQNGIRDLIQWTEIAPWEWQPQNVAEARIRGLESKLETHLAGWDLSGSLTLLEPKDRETGLVLPRRSRQTLRLDLDRGFGATELGFSFILQGRRYEDAANTQKMGGYGLMNLRLSHRLDDSWRIRGLANNLFDKEYETAKDYNNLGRELFISIIYTPKL
jgi:vitamin B12 transporter